MKNKKLILCIIILAIIIILICFFIIKNFSVENTEENTYFTEYTPEEEISTEQLRKTIVTLYFLNTDSNELKSEGRLIDSNELLQNPYKKLVELLLEGPTTSSLTSIIPENTQIYDASLENHCAILNFSSELLEFTDDAQKYNIINSILNTLTELNEVESIKILIDGNTHEAFEEEYLAIH